MGYLEDQLENVVRDVEAAGAGLLQQVECLGELEGLLLVAVNLRERWTSAILSLLDPRPIPSPARYVPQPPACEQDLRVLL